MYVEKNETMGEVAQDVLVTELIIMEVAQSKFCTFDTIFDPLIFQLNFAMMMSLSKKEVTLPLCWKSRATINLL